MGKKKSTIAIQDLPPLYRCVKCGKVVQNPKGVFYVGRSSELYDANDGYVHICVTCVNKYFEDMTARFRDERIALILTCAAIGAYYSDEIYESMLVSDEMKFGYFIRKLNCTQHSGKNFSHWLLHMLRCETKARDEMQEEKEARWSIAEQRNKNEVLSVVGYDPFENYSNADRRFLFNELVKYLDEDLADDSFKLSQIIQIVNNNNQIRLFDYTIGTLNPIKDGETIRTLNRIKSDLVSANDKIAKENEISVKNRSNKEVGKSTLGYLQKELREKNIPEAESNYYDQLSSAGSQWAVDMSHRSILQNAMFDENDRQEIFETQRTLISKLQADLDRETEKCRVLTIQVNELNEKLGGASNG